MKNVYVFMADGFEEIEALAPVDILRRAGAEVTLLSAGGLTVKGARGVSVVCDGYIKDADMEKADMIVLPGGYPGFENLAASRAVADAIEYMDRAGKYIAAICGAPAAVLGKNGYLKDKSAVCYPGMEQELCCKEVSGDNVCVSGNCITSKSAATALEFAFVLCELLMGAEVSNKVKKAIVYND